MTSKQTRAAIKEPLKSLFGAREKTSSSALVTVKPETQVQPYAKGGELVGPLREPESPVDDNDGPTTYTLVVEQNVSTLYQSSTGQSFLEWVTFDEVELPTREDFKRARRDKVFDPLNEVELGLPGEVEVSGFGGLFKSVHNLLHSRVHLDFLESKRDILLPPSAEASKPEPMSTRELMRLEAELFDITRYNGSCDVFTAVSWSEENDQSGSITLYRVQSTSRGIPLGVKPVSAMQRVPNPILVDMRKYVNVKKLVFVPSDEDARRFKWKANTSRGPTYSKLRDANEATSSHSKGDRSPSHDSRDSRDRSRGPSLADADGVHATIPQFVALLHASRSILEEVKSSHVTSRETEDGKFTPVVELVKPPRSNAHMGANVHVAVFVPDEAEWADEHIFWTDREGLPELRRKKYWGLIEQERRRDDHGSRSRSRHASHSHGHSRHQSPDDEGRPHRSRSQSRHLLHKIF